MECYFQLYEKKRGKKKSYSIFMGEKKVYCSSIFLPFTVGEGRKVPTFGGHCNETINRRNHC